MTCREFIDFLMAYLNGELPVEERARFDEHLAICPDCVNYLESYAETVRLGREAFTDPAENVPASVPEELVQAILASREKTR